MTTVDDLAAKKARIVALEDEIAAQQRKFEESIGGLRSEHEQLTRDYADALRNELASIGASARGRRSSTSSRAPRGSRAKPDAAAVLSAIERAQDAISVERIRELAGVPAAVPANSMSLLLRSLVDEGRVAREGQRRGTKYRIR